MGSGKTSTVVKLQEFFQLKEKEVVVVSEEQLLGGLDKNGVFADSKHEKEGRGRLKSEVVRLLSKENVIICDELYCASKHIKTTQVTLQCDLSPEDSQSFNEAREASDQYSEDILKQLIQRYEAPISSNRWDSPLFLVLRDGKVDCDGIYDALFNKKPPPPNQSTQNAPLSNTNFVYELDKQTQAVISAIMDGQKTSGAGSEIFIPGSKDKVYLKRNYTLPELARTKRQFLVSQNRNLATMC